MAKKKLYDKYVDGDNFTNAEVLEGITTFKKAADALSGLGSAFSIPRKEADRVYWAFRGFGLSRGIYKEE